jgi:predicted small lipoprotein YifL
MMKKIILLIITILGVLSLTACGGYTYYIPERETPQEEITEEELQVLYQELFDEYGGTWAYS